MLNEHVEALALKEGLSKKDLQEMPCTIASAREFEIAGQVIAQLGIANFMNKKLADNTRWWGVLPFMTHEFQGELKNVSWEAYTAELKKLTENVIRVPV
jgi:hypothetical protein